MRIPLIALGVAGLVLACPPGGERAQYATYLPKATTITPACFAVPPDSIPLATIRTRVRQGQIRFDTVLGAADSQIVDLTPAAPRLKSRRARPARPKAVLVQAVVEPEENAWRVDMDLARGKGWSCIIGQIRTAREVAAGDLRLGGWDTWWVVHYDGTAWASTFVADNDKIDIPSKRPRRSMRPTQHPGHRWNQSIARFRHSDLVIWGVCGDMCCVSPVAEQ